MIDYAAAWTELGAWIAEEPNRGRLAILQQMAELAAKHQVPEDELDRALRLVAPRLQELLLNRLPELAKLLTQEDVDHEVGEGSAVRRPEAVRPSIAAAV